jgi:hypothetical protein
MAKKFFSTVAFFMIMLLTTVSFTSCSDDDDDEKGATSTLVGTWVLTASEGYTIYNGKKYEHKETYTVEEQEFVLELNADGTYVYDGESTGTWKMDGDKLMIITEEGETETVKITKLTDNTLILEITEEDYYDKSTYTKVK